ncbi:hypothetical protein NWP22_16075 [Anabaenopsis tanganyikae CS-531]|uniref:Uncharacterized protein n=1 Tax=Anabaenopsis tanganyikae CS-531 TaxID=2785304 RepID=A0ABT6KIK0_9CYAN|nr:MULTISPECIES: hypothetical protein [Anabaenopsis]MDH6093738.1 hypothetical protein [Anabaenopsis arnoldii]MDH6107360.1 hypothetical protein [Anabaenopsis tanganyikae CS-531]
MNLQRILSELGTQGRTPIATACVSHCPPQKIYDINVFTLLILKVL